HIRPILIARIDKCSRPYSHFRYDPKQRELDDDRGMAQQVWRRLRTQAKPVKAPAAKRMVSNQDIEVLPTRQVYTHARARKNIAQSRGWHKTLARICR
ncbi:MAG TPA: hypothetical protein VKB53_13645, partial [Gammaproteobacteria bacterium]|nr:hypothetical protein [Gammaproteobacteria bacterium]